MLVPIPYREFERLVKRHGCTLERNGSHGKVKKHGTTISTLGVTHGKNTKGDEVKPGYVKDFLNNLS